MEHWTLWDTLAFLLLLSLFLPLSLTTFIPLTSRRPVSSWKALNLLRTSSMASKPRFVPLNSSRLPCVYAPGFNPIWNMPKKTSNKNYAPKE